MWPASAMDTGPLRILHQFLHQSMDSGQWSLCHLPTLPNSVDWVKGRAWCIKYRFQDRGMCNLAIYPPYQFPNSSSDDNYFLPEPSELSCLTPAHTNPHSPWHYTPLLHPHTNKMAPHISLSPISALFQASTHSPTTWNPKPPCADQPTNPLVFRASTNINNTWVCYSFFEFLCSHWKLCCFRSPCPRSWLVSALLIKKINHWPL